MNPSRATRIGQFGRLGSIGLLATTATLATLLSAGCELVTSGPGDKPPGETEFTNEEPGQGPPPGTSDLGVAADAGGVPAADGGNKADETRKVEEADIYRLADNRLFYLNTYRGLLIYDVADPDRPRPIGRLPIYGVPVEMFVSGTTAFALVRDVLYLDPVTGRLELAPQRSSELVTIDLSDPARPRIAQRFPIIGQLREGVSRKIGSTIYVVSYQPSGWWGWGVSTPAKNDTAWVYSFDITDPARVRQVGSLQLFEGAAVQQQTQTGWVSKSFNGVAISATPEALMVVENWYVTEQSTAGPCPGWSSDQRAVVSLIDVSDPRGTIRRTTRFEQPGTLSDQFKQTYLYDPVKKQAIYFGIFSRQGWQGGGGTRCTGATRVVENTLVSMDVSDGNNPRELSALKFGKPNETVRGSVFDPTRKVAYAITAQAIDPLYVLDYSDPRALRIRSLIDGLSGDMSVFTFAGSTNFLLGVGRDTSSACTGVSDERAGTRMAVTVIDVRALDAIRLVQRRCVSVANSGWQWSQVSWNQDQAHKMLGLYGDGSLNLIGVPVSYWQQSSEGGWGETRSAIGLMRWDLGAYDPAKDPSKQTVLTDLGTIAHPHGEVERTIFYRQGTDKRLMVLTLSRSHLAISDLNDLARPVRRSEVEVAPNLAHLYRVGSSTVEVTRESDYSWSYGQGPSELRVRAFSAGARVEDQPIIGRLVTRDLQGTVVVGDRLIGLRPPAGSKSGSLEATVFDLANPTQPRERGSVMLTSDGYYYYYATPESCGRPCAQVRGSLDGYSYYGYGNGGIAVIDEGIATVRRNWWSGSGRYELVRLDIRDPDRPTASSTALPAGTDDTYYDVVVAEDDPRLFYVPERTLVERKIVDGKTVNVYKHWAQAWRRGSNGAWSAAERINLPGRLVHAFRLGGERAFLTSERVWQTRDSVAYASPVLDLLAEARAGDKVYAVRRDRHVLDGYSGGTLVRDGARLHVLDAYSYYGSKPSPGVKFAGFDLSAWRFTTRFAITAGVSGWTQLAAAGGRWVVMGSYEGQFLVDTEAGAGPTAHAFVGASQSSWYRPTHLFFDADHLHVAAGRFGVLDIDLRVPSLGR